MFIAPMLAACAACIPLDRRPPWTSLAYSQLVAEVRQAGGLARTTSGTFEAGWARLPIEAPPDAPLAGHGARGGAPHDGVKDQPHVRAIALANGGRRVVILAADLLLIERQLRDLVRARVERDDPGTELFFTASHTHSSLGGFVDGVVFERVLGRFDERILASLVETFVRAAREATENLAPAAIGVSELGVAGLCRNRIEVAGPTDDDLFILRFDRIDGRSAALYSFGCHPTTLPASNMALSADYPGQVAAVLEGRDVDLLAFAAGGVGSTEPTDSQIESTLADKVREGLVIAQHQSRRHGSLSSARVDLPFPPIRYRIMADTALPESLVKAVIGFERLSFEVVSVDTAALLFVPVEMSGELTKAARRAARRQGFALAALPFNGTYAGYVGTRRAYDLPASKTRPLHAYETRLLTFFGPWGGDLMMNLSLRLLSTVRGNQGF